MLPALENKAIDGYATSMPFTTQAIVKGSAVMLARPRAMRPICVPFAYGLVYAKPETCRDSARCARAWRARWQAPQNSSARNRPRRWRSCASASTGSIREMLNAAWQVGVEGACAGRAGHHRGAGELAARQPRGRILAEKDALKSFEGLYTDEFLR